MHCRARAGINGRTYRDRDREKERQAAIDVLSLIEVQLAPAESAVAI